MELTVYSSTPVSNPRQASEAGLDCGLLSPRIISLSPPPPPPPPELARLLYSGQLQVQVRGGVKWCGGGAGRAPQSVGGSLDQGKTGMGEGGERCGQARDRSA